MYRKTVLDNGMRLLTAAMPHTRAVSVNFFIAAGSRYEDEANAGISHFLEHLCFRGTERRPTGLDISTAIEGTGGSINAGTDKEMTLYWCKVAQQHLELALDVLTDMLLHSRFDPGDIERERQVIIEEIHMCNDAPAQRVSMLIDELLFPGHPLGRDIAGTRESVSAITRDMLLEYMARLYCPRNMVLSIAGGIDHEQVIERVNNLLGSWSSDGCRADYAPFEEGAFRRVLVEKRKIEQVNLCLGLPGLSLKQPERFAMNLLNIMLGEGMSSRLFTEIRDRLGLAYSIHSFVDFFQDCGSLTVAAGVDAGKVEEAIKAILEQLARFRDDIPQEELEKARELYKGRLLLRLEDSRSVAGWMGGEEILTGRILTPDDVISLTDAVTVDGVLALAREVLEGDRLRLAAVGPVKREDPLEGLLRL